MEEMDSMARHSRMAMRAGAAAMAAIMALAPAAPAFANGTLEVKANDGTFEIYKVADGAGDIPSNVLLTSDIWKKAYENDGSPNASDDGMYKWLVEQQSDMPALAYKLAGAVDDLGVKPTRTIAANGTASLDEGHYLVMGGSGGAAMIATVADGETLTINDKASYPVHEQFVDENSVDEGPIYKRADVAVGVWFENETYVKLPANLDEYSREIDKATNLPVKAAQAATNTGVGTVTMLTGLDKTVPYKFVIKESLGAPFEVNPSSVKVVLNSAGGTNTDITSDISAINVTSDNNLVVTFDDLASVKTAHPAFAAGDALTMTYDAKLVPPDYTMGAAEPNIISSTVEYPKGAYTDERGETVVSTTSVYTYGVRIRFRDPADASADLSGLSFYVKNDEGKYYTRSGEWADKPGDDARWSATAEGIVSIPGLDAAHYVLENASMPEGYKELENVDLIISSNVTDGDEPLKLTVSVNGEDAVSLEGVDAESGIIDLAIDLEKLPGEDTPGTSPSDNGLGNGWGSGSGSSIPKMSDLVAGYGGIILASCAFVALCVSFIVSAIKRRRDDDGDEDME